MKREQKMRGLYAIVDSGFCPQGNLAALAHQYLAGGCRILQLRMKGPQRGSDLEIEEALQAQRLRVAREIMRFKEAYDFTFFLNDDVEVALAVGADGVHVGEHDEPVQSIRERVGDRLRIGYSSHSLEEALAAEDAGADTIAFGAIFPTATKGPGHPVQGLERLAALAQKVHVPLIAIGGINRQNVRNVVEAGADAVAMITALAQAPDVVAETKWFVDAIASVTRDL